MLYFPPKAVSGLLLFLYFCWRLSSNFSFELCQIHLEKEAVFFPDCSLSCGREKVITTGWRYRLEAQRSKGFESERLKGAGAELALH